jgi:hypothetical protein
MDRMDFAGWITECISTEWIFTGWMFGGCPE